MEEGRRVGGGEVPHRHRDAAEVLARRAEGVHVAPREHAHPRGRRVKAVRHVPAVVHVLENGRGGKAVAAAAKAVPAALVHGAVHNHGLGDAGGHGHGRVQHGRARCTTAMRHLREEADVARTQQAGNLVFGHLVHRVRREAVHLGGVDPGIRQRGQRGLHRQAQLGAAGVLAELGGAQPNDGCAAGDALHVHGAHWTTLRSLRDHLPEGERAPPSDGRAVALMATAPERCP